MYKIIIVSVMVTFLGGCASPARIDQMTVPAQVFATQAPISTQLTKNIFIVDVQGGEATNPMWTSEIGNSEFKIALENSLRSAKLLSTLINKADYKLEAKLISVNQPMFGLDFTVHATVLYSLVDNKTGETVYEETIMESHTATMNDAFMGVERLKLANEGAARNNIKELISRLMTLKV